MRPRRPLRLQPQTMAHAFVRFTFGGVCANGLFAAFFGVSGKATFGVSGQAAATARTARFRSGPITRLRKAAILSGDITSR